MGLESGFGDQLNFHVPLRILYHGERDQSFSNAVCSSSKGINVAVGISLLMPVRF
jgi:hypothetical protein